MLKPAPIPRPTCFKCGEPAFWQQRMAVPVKGTKDIPIYLFTGDHACRKCREGGIKAADVLTATAMDVARAAMHGKEPDFPRAFLEWMAIP